MKINEAFIKEAEEFNKKFCICGAKLIHDKLSEKYGDYCPNLNCDYLNLSKNKVEDYKKAMLDKLDKFIVDKMKNNYLFGEDNVGSI